MVTNIIENRWRKIQFRQLSACLQSVKLRTVTCWILQNEMVSASSVVIFGCHVVNMESDVVKKDTHVVKIAVHVEIVKLWYFLDRVIM